MIWAAVWAGAMAGAGSSVGMEESVIAIGNSASQSARPPVISARDQDGVQRDPVRQDSGKARKDLKRERDDLRRGWRPHKNGGVEGKAGKSALIISMPAGAGGTAEQEFKVEVCGREERNKYGRKGSEAVKRSCSK